MKMMKTMTKSMKHTAAIQDGRVGDDVVKFVEDRNMSIVSDSN